MTRSVHPSVPATGGAEPLGTAPSTLISLFGVSLPEPRVTRQLPFIDQHEPHRYCVLCIFSINQQWTNATHNIPVPAAQHNFPYLQCLVLRQCEYTYANGKLNDALYIIYRVRRATATAVGGREGFDATRWRREKLPPGDYNTVHAQCTRHGLRFPTPVSPLGTAPSLSLFLTKATGTHDVGVCIPSTAFD
jgi:hypothetical protein